ncbi:MAG: hypothetical protein ACREFY_13125 [Acetobacteraceae bacterium]
MTYIPPMQVLGPPQLLDRVDEVLHDGGEGGWAAALVTWQGRSGTLALRWNGSQTDVNGSPQTTGRAAWFICPSELGLVLIPYIRGRRAADAPEFKARIREIQQWTRELVQAAPDATVDDFIAERHREAERE